MFKIYSIFGLLYYITLLLISIVPDLIFPKVYKLNTGNDDYIYLKNIATTISIAFDEIFAYLFYIYLLFLYKQHSLVSFELTKYDFIGNFYKSSINFFTKAKINVNKN